MAARVQIELTATGAGDVQRVFRGIADSAESLGGSLRRVFEIASGVSLSNVFTQMAGAVRQLTHEVVTLGLEAKVQEDAFNRLTKSVGVSGDALVNALQKASGGVLNTSDVMIAAARGLQEALQPDQLVALMEVARVQAKLTGKDTAEAFNILGTAVANNQPKLLKQLGINIDAEAAQEKYLAAIGKTGEKLTEAGLAQATFAAIMERTRSTVAALTTEGLSQAEMIQKWSGQWKQLKEDIGKVAIDAGFQLLAWIQEMSTAIQASPWFARLSESVIALGVNTQEFVTLWETAWASIVASATAAFDALNPILGGAITTAFKLALAAVSAFAVGINAMASVVIGPLTFLASVIGDISSGKLPDLSRATLEANVATAEQRVRLAESVEAFQALGNQATTSALSVTKAANAADLGKNSLAALAAQTRANAADAKKLDDVLASATTKLVQIANAFQPEDVQKLAAVSAEFETLARKADELGAKGAGIAAKIREMGSAAVALTQGLQDQKILDTVNAGWVAHAEAVLAATEAEQQGEAAIAKTNRALAEQRDALLEAQGVSGWVAYAEAVIAATEAEQQAEVGIMRAARTRADAADAFGTSLARIGAQAALLGPDFDMAGARIAAMQTELTRLLELSQNRVTPEIAALGAQIRTSLADQSLYDTIKGGFLSVSNTFSTMIKGIVMGTQTAGEALKNFAQNIGLGFVDFMIQKVFNVVASAAAEFFTGLIAMMLGRGGSSGLGAVGSLLGVVGSFFGASGGGSLAGDVAFASSAAGLGLGAGGAASGGGGDILGTLGTLGSALGTVYQGLVHFFPDTFPSLLTLAGQGVEALAGSLGLLTPALSTASEAILFAAGTGAAAGIEGGSALAGGAVAGVEAVAAGGGALTGILEGISSASIYAPFLALATGIIMDALSSAQLRHYRAFIDRQREIQQEALTGQALGRLSAVEGGTLSANNPAFRQDLTWIATLFARSLDQTSANIIENTRPDSSLTEMNTPGMIQFLKDQYQGLLDAFTPFLTAAKAAGIEPIAGPTGEGFPEHILDLVTEAFGERQQEVIARYVAVLTRVATAMDEAGKPMSLVALQAGFTAESFNIIAEALGVAAQAVPDFAAALESDIPSLLETMRHGLIESLVADPIKITGLLDLGSLAKEGETIQQTAQRMATALQGLGVMMTSLGEEAGLLRNGLGTIPEQLKKVTDAITKEMAAAQNVLATTADPEVMLASAQRLRELIIAEQQATVQAIETLAARVQDFADQITTAAADMAAKVRGYEDQIAQVRERGARERAQLEQQILDTQTKATARLRELSDELISTGLHLARLGETFSGFSIRITGLTAAMFDLITALGDAEQRLKAFPGFLSALRAEVAQNIPATGARAFDPNAVAGERLGTMAAIAGPVIAGLFSDVLAIGDPEQRLTALLTLSDQAQTFYQQTIADVHTLFEAARTAARTLYDERIEAINTERTAAQEVYDARIKVLSAERDALSTQRAALQETVEKAKEWKRIAESLGNTLKDLRSGGQAPPDAQAQFAAAQAAFASAKPEEAGAAAQKLLDTAIHTGLMTLPSPAYEALFDQVTARLEELKAQAEGQAAGGDPAVVQLISIDARLAAIGEEEKALRENLDTTLKSLDAEAKAAGIALTAYLAGLDAQEKTLVTDIQTAFAPLFTAFGTAIVGTAGAVAALGPGIAQGAADTTALLRALIEQSGFAEALQIGHLSTLIQTEYLVGLATVNQLERQYWQSVLELNELTAGRTAQDAIKAATEKAATALDTLSSDIHESLRTLVGDRINALINLGGPGDVKKALDESASLGAIRGSTYATGYNTAELVRGVFRGEIGSIIPTAQFGMRDTGPVERLVITHPHERILTAAEKRSYEAGGGGGSVTVTFAPGSILVSGADDPQTIARKIVRALDSEVRQRGGVLLPRR